MEELPEQFWQGVREFQQGQFYECHDTLEALWIEAREPNKTCFQGILQIAVACYHLSHNNWKGAVILLGEGIRRLVTYQPEYVGLDIEHLVNTSADLLEHLQHIGPEGAKEYNLQTADPIYKPILRQWT